MSFRMNYLPKRTAQYEVWCSGKFRLEQVHAAYSGKKIIAVFSQFGIIFFGEARRRPLRRARPVLVALDHVVPMKHDVFYMYVLYY